MAIIPAAALALALTGSVATDVPTRPADVDDTIAEVSPERLRATIDRLVTFGTRHTLSDADDPNRGIGAARRWLRDELRRIADATGRDDITVELMHHAQRPMRRVPNEIDIVNVVMTVPGTMPESRDRRIVVLGHYDSRASDPMNGTIDAPGANDDGSGTALVLEAAEVLAGAECEATLVFLMTAGEEQGLLGATWFARTAVDNDWIIDAALSNDIIGDPTGPGGRVDRHHVRVFSEGVPRNATDIDMRTIRALGSENDSPSRQLARYLVDIGARHETTVRPRMIYRTDRFLRGGDHTSFNEMGFAAVRFSEVSEHYDRQHQDVREEDGVRYGDLAPFVDEAYLADVTRLNVAAIMTLANGPAAPANARLITAGLTSDTTIRWERAPEPDVAGYEVVYRDTTAPQWEHVIDVGNRTEFTIDLSKDNWFFGVRAYDRDGHRSLVSFPRAARR